MLGRDYDTDHIFVKSWVNIAKSWDIYLMELGPILRGDNVEIDKMRLKVII